MRVHNARRKLRIGRLKTDVHQTAIGDALHAQAAQKLSKFGRTFLVCQTAAGDGLGGPVGSREFQACRKSVVANGLEGQRFAGKNFGLRLDIVFKIHHEIVGVGALEGKDVGVFAVNLNASSSDVHGLHAKSSDGNNGNDSEHERKNQPLVLP